MIANCGLKSRNTLTVSRNHHLYVALALILPDLTLIGRHTICVISTCKDCLVLYVPLNNCLRVVEQKSRRQTSRNRTEMASGFRMTGANDNGVIQGTATQVSHLRDLSKEVEELEDELRAMQGYMYKLKNQHRRTLYFRAASNAYRACARTVKATSTLILSLRRGKHGNNEMAQSQLSKDSFCTLYKESFRRLHLAAR